MSTHAGKTAPRLLQDLLTYDPRREDRAGRNLLTTPPPHFNPEVVPQPAVPRGNCRHIFLTKHEQSLLPVAGVDPQYDTVYKIASICQNCRWHLDLRVDFRDDGSKTSPCVKDTEYPIHHFVYKDSAASQRNPFGNQAVPPAFTFACTAPKCPVEVRIRLSPPFFSSQDIMLLTDTALLRKRLEAARLMDPGRDDTQMARPVDVLSYLSTYLQDSLQPQIGKSRIPLMNRKFLKAFGRDCDDILTCLGFTHHQESETGESVEAWYLPKPPPLNNPLNDNTRRNVVDDALYELGILLQQMPAEQRTNVRHPAIQPPPSITDLQRALNCLDYDKKPMSRMEARSTNHEEAHPYYAGLGALEDFSDALLYFAYSRQVSVDKLNSPYYFECIQDIAIGRKSLMLEEKVQMLASAGQNNRQEVYKAYWYFSIEPQHAPYLADDVIIGRFKARLQDISPAQYDETRRMLSIIGEARQSELIRQQASDTIETYEQAMRWLDLDEGHADDFVAAMHTYKVNENVNNLSIANKAVEIVARHRGSQRLLEFLKNGSLMGEPEMDAAEAYALFGINDRTEALDLEVLAAQVETYKMTNPDSAAKYDKAHELLRKDQTENHKIAAHQPPRQEHPLETWPVGCHNIGNTCYLNSVLQFLFTVKTLRERVLECEKYLQDTSPEALKNKKVGRLAVTQARVEKAQQFVFELRKLFLRMIDAPTHSVRPEQKLAELALVKSDAEAGTSVAINSAGPAVEQGLDAIGGLPVLGPILPPKQEAPGQNGIPTPADSVIGDDQDKARSETSSTVAAVDPDEDQPMDLEGETDTETTKPELPSRPPPVPPRPDNTIKTIETWAQQQDASEILNNVFDLLSTAFEGEGVLDDGEQQDMIKDLFFCKITRSWHSEGKIKRVSALHDAINISPGERNRPLYAALDDSFRPAESEPGVPLKEVIEQAPPFLIINVRRILFDRKTQEAKKNESHVALDPVLYLDRYLRRTKSRTEDDLQKLWDDQLQLRQNLKAIEKRKATLKETEVKATLSDAVKATASLVENINKASEDQLVDVEDDPLPKFPELPNALRDRAKELHREAEELDSQAMDIDTKISTVFKDCVENKYLLHAIFMHRGSARGGHYWIYIYDFQSEMWRSYNDERVDEVTDVSKIFEQEEKYPATSTGIIYVHADVVHRMTEAVHRQPETGITTNGAETHEVMMMDDVQVIDGIEKDGDKWSDATTVDILLDGNGEAQNDGIRSTHKKNDYRYDFVDTKQFILNCEAFENPQERNSIPAIDKPSTLEKDFPLADCSSLGASSSVDSSPEELMAN